MARETISIKVDGETYTVDRGQPTLWIGERGRVQGPAEVGRCPNAVLPRARARGDPRLTRRRSAPPGPPARGFGA